MNLFKREEIFTRCKCASASNICYQLANKYVEVVCEPCLKKKLAENYVTARQVYVKW